MLKVGYQKFYVNASVWKKKDECELNGEAWIRAAQPRPWQASPAM